MDSEFFPNGLTDKRQLELAVETELAVHWIVTSFWHPESPGKQIPPKLNFGPG
jgi:hypothetical protein